ncbi:hypothetical protein SAMN05443575_1801 [Jatrophihabitans endophyticus]|uniref:DUF2000 domain-containing protein n=1 Tax=Jatrophihabitans endophyticus TaxID=1206085 RepID=A0A1M5IA89_9ACTN|nr:DUF2000 domain-containing protein [Jatrophihabitans endophyticus]SHG24693.1 hypothetical protein SAMN05443575_1801 [Jatrophihabitans endophyticus]
MSESTVTPRADTKLVVAVRDDLATWQKLNMTAFLVSGIAATAPESIGKPYRDADGTRYLPMFGQPTLVFAASADELRRTMTRALSRGAVPSVFTDELFGTGNDGENRAAVAAVRHDDLSLAGLAFRCDRKDADKITKGLRLHS